MKEIRPACDPNGVYSVKRTCAELGISNKTLKKYRDNGYIQPLNPNKREFDIRIEIIYLKIRNIAIKALNLWCQI